MNHGDCCDQIRPDWTGQTWPWPRCHDHAVDAETRYSSAPHSTLAKNQWALYNVGTVESILSPPKNPSLVPSVSILQLSQTSQPALCGHSKTRITESMCPDSGQYIESTARVILPTFLTCYPCGFVEFEFWQLLAYREWALKCELMVFIKWCWAWEKDPLFVSRPQLTQGIWRCQIPHCCRRVMIYCEKLCFYCCCKSNLILFGACVYCQ